MKSLSRIIIGTLFAGYIASLSSCTVTFRHDNGKHKGWFKNPKNPHNPRTTNPKPPKKKGKGHNSAYSLEIPYRYQP